VEPLRAKLESELTLIVNPRPRNKGKAASSAPPAAPKVPGEAAQPSTNGVPVATEPAPSAN
jgi:glyoxalase family protein